MSKIVIVVVLVFSDYSCQQNINDVRVNLQREISGFQTYCIAKTHPDQLQIENVLINSDFGEDESLKCFFDCVLTTTLAFDQNFNFDNDFVVALVGDGRQDIVNGVIDQCKAADGYSDCGKTYEMLRCALTLISDLI